MTTTTRGALLGLTSFASFASGAGALAFESLWFREASWAFGNTVWACSLVLSAFMGGMALGSWLGGRYGDRARQPALLFCALETLVAVSGNALVLGLPQLQRALALWSARLEALPLLQDAVRLGVAFALLLVPATALGMSLPALVSAARVPGARFGRSFGLLYGANTLGAVAGVLLCETRWVAAFGVRTSALLAGACSLTAAAVGGGASRLSAVKAHAITPPAAADARAAPFLIASALCGFAALGLEVIWLRYLMLFLNDTELAFSWVLACVLCGVALGALLAAAISSKTQPGYAALSAYGAALFGCFGLVLANYTAAHRFQPDQQLSTLFGLSAPLVLPCTICSGLLYAQLAAGLHGALGRDARAAGQLALANLLGAVLGSSGAGFVLLPRFGIERSLFALYAVYAAAGGILLLARSPLSPRARLLASLACAVGLACFPFGGLRSVYLRASVGRWMQPGDRLGSMREELNATLAHVVHRFNGRPLFDQLAANAYSMSVNDFAARRYMKEFALLPRALHPHLARALLLGYGAGNTARALLDAPELERLDVVDTSPGMLALSRELHAVPRADPLADPRVRVHIEDARQFMRGHAEHYDLITGEPPPPIIAGVVNLYTREYFELLRARLAPGGMVSYWLPLMNMSAPAAKALIAAFCGALPDCTLWHGSARNFMLLGTRGALGPVSADHFEAAWQSPAQRAELSDLGFELPAQLGAAFIGGADYLRELTRGVAPLLDDWPKRIVQEGSYAERDALIWSWRDTRLARERFARSRFIARLWPVALREASEHQFENQRLLNDLLFPEQTPVRQTYVLHQVLYGTPLRLPVLLMLGSDPDVQRIVRGLSDAELQRPEWQLHRLAGALAARDFAAARSIVERMPDEVVPLPELREYVEFVALRGPPRPRAVTP